MRLARFLRGETIAEISARGLEGGADFWGILAPAKPKGDFVGHPRAGAFAERAS